MKLRIFSLLATALLFAGCLKSDKKCDYVDGAITVPQSQIDEIKAYLTSKGITDAVQSPYNFFYRITNPGTGVVVSNLCTVITVAYTGKLKNDAVVEQSTTANPLTGDLGMAVVGWQKGLPLIKSGGSITLYVPPYLAYGDTPKTDQNGAVIIPGGSMMIYDVQVISYQNQ
jgi:FKBP-type peptidyl-prolyl cis-trans isomerase FkpA